MVWLVDMVLMADKVLWWFWMVVGRFRVLLECSVIARALSGGCKKHSGWLLGCC